MSGQESNLPTLSEESDRGGTGRVQLNERPATHRPEHDKSDGSESKSGFWAKCRACAHCWIVCYLPMEITKAAKLIGKAACPNCGDARPLVAKQDNGQLLEEVRA